MRTRVSAAALLLLALVAACGGSSDSDPPPTEPAPTSTAAAPPTQAPVAPVNNLGVDELIAFHAVCMAAGADQFSPPAWLPAFQQIPQDRLDEVVRPAMQKIVAAGGPTEFELLDGSGGTITTKTLCGTILFQEAGTYMTN